MRNKEHMISPETRVQIRRYFYAEHWKIGTIARELNVHPDAVRNAIESEPPRNAIEFSSAASRANPELVRSPLPPILWRAVRAMPQQSATESLQTVLALCREWEQQSHASH